MAPEKVPLPSAPTQIGPYRILDALGEGGMGTVYVAEQQAPVKRRVALKLIKLGMDSKAVVARFEQERQALALMDHEGIAKVFDCGTSERGQPFFVMELVKGTPLTDYCDRNRLPLPQRIALMQQVCDAVQHAHQKGVVHRDLKPGNVLVAEEAGRPRIKIIDFGLAKAMGQKLVEATLFTEAGQVVGTPEYMAPEQADPTNQDIDTRADVYSLGVMLYEVLTGQLPFSANELRGAGLLEMQRVLREVDPPKPSTKLSSVGASATAIAEQRRIGAPALLKALRSDLDWLVLKSIEKDRARRYETANALKMDLQRFLDHEPLVAGPPSAAYRLKKLMRRYRVQAIASGAVLGTAIIGAFVAMNYAIAADENARLATTNEHLATARAEENGRLAQEKGALATSLDSKVREFDQLATLVLYERVIAKEKELYPPWPHMIEAMERWLSEDAGKLLAGQDDIAATIQSLEARAKATPVAVGQPPFRFEMESQRFLHDTLVELAGKIASLETRERAQVAQRLRWARQVQQISLAHPNARHTWASVRAAIARNPNYAGEAIELREQDITGLVPIGENPATHLWEFYELRSAWDGTEDPGAIAIPQHASDGSIEVKGETGIVFVLLPAGTVQMAHAEVALRGFFIARHELTIGQWARLWSASEHDVGPPDVHNLRWPESQEWGGLVPILDDDGRVPGSNRPVGNVSWDMCTQLLTQHGMRLPSDAQWEYAARGADTSRPEWLGDALFASLSRSRLVSTPKDSASAGNVNSNGLYGVSGGTMEWCRDAYSYYWARTDLETDPDGVRFDSRDSHSRVLRGDYPPHVTTQERLALRPFVRMPNLGSRPVRPVRQ